MVALADCTAAALVHDIAVRSCFDVVVFLPFGQAPVLRDLQNVMHIQLLGNGLDGGLSNEEACACLTNAARGKRVLCVLDDVWTEKVYLPFSRLLDESTPSRMLVTTRVKGPCRMLLNSSSASVAGRCGQPLLECAGENAIAVFEHLYKSPNCAAVAMVLSMRAGSWNSSTEASSKASLLSCRRTTAKCCARVSA